MPDIRWETHCLASNTEIGSWQYPKTIHASPRTIAQSYDYITVYPSAELAHTCHAAFHTVKKQPELKSLMRSSTVPFSSHRVHITVRLSLMNCMASSTQLCMCSIGQFYMLVGHLWLLVFEPSLILQRDCREAGHIDNSSKYVC